MTMPDDTLGISVWPDERDGRVWWIVADPLVFEPLASGKEATQGEAEARAEEALARLRAARAAGG